MNSPRFFNDTPGAQDPDAADAQPRPIRLTPADRADAETLDLTVDASIDLDLDLDADLTAAAEPLLVHGGVAVHEETDAAGIRQVVLVKDGQRHGFPCPVGRESELLSRLAGVVADGGNPLTWFDAALICHQLGERMGLELSERLSERPRRRPA